MFGFNLEWKSFDVCYNSKYEGLLMSLSHIFQQNSSVNIEISNITLDDIGEKHYHIYRCDGISSTSGRTPPLIKLSKIGKSKKLSLFIFLLGFKHID